MQRAKDKKEREKVIAQFDQWVADLTLPYFKEHRGPDGDFSFKSSGKPSEEERRLKKMLCKLACNEIRYSKLCTPAEKGKVDPLPLPMPNNTQPPWWPPLPQPYQRDSCKNMLDRLYYSHSTEEWLKFLEDCWHFIVKLPQKRMIVSKVIDKVVTLEHTERLEKWSLKTFGDRNRYREMFKPKIINRNSYTRASKRFFKDLVDTKVKNVNAATECKEVFFDIVKDIFKDKDKDKGRI